MKKLLFSLILILAAGCNDRPLDERASETTDDSCEEGESQLLPSGVEVCIFKKPIVIETGFLCPAVVPNRFDFQSFLACDARTKIPRPDLDLLNYLDIVGRSDSPWQIDEVPVELASTDKLDLLWVIDNSGSMCQEQAQLRDSFTRFINRLAEKDVDFHIGVTTTHMEADYPLEPVARPGELQSTPQPVVGFDRSCQNAIDADGQLIEGDWTPVREQLDVAVGCMRQPDSRFLQWTDAEIECALQRGPVGCEIPAIGCGGTADTCKPEDLFPDPSDYRPISKVLRSQDYQTSAGLDVERLRADFACASLVGTRGHGIERGLGAAVEAVSPSKATAGGPNAGFIRSDARFGLFVVTDENDCSHDGTLDLNTACGADICAIYNQPGQNDSPLLEISSLRDELVYNLSQVKGRHFDSREVLVASFHGAADRVNVGISPNVCTPYEEPNPDPENNSTDSSTPTSTQNQLTWSLSPVCASANGVSYSGDRYDRFLRSFPLGNTYPYASNATIAIEGLTCSGMLAPSLEQAGEFLAGAVNP